MESFVNYKLGIKIVWLTYLTMTSFPPLSTVVKGMSQAGDTLKLLPIAKHKSAATPWPKLKSRSFS
jgi:hypothetical protein